MGGHPPPTGLMRTPHTPGGYQPHAKDLLFYFVSYTKVGLLISVGVEGCWRVFGVLSGPCQSPGALV